MSDPNIPQAPEVPGYRHVYSGKVRDLYVPDDASGSSEGASEKVLVVASDRISAYDHVLSTVIPDKGAVLTQLSLWWFERLSEGPNPVAHHVLSTEVPAEVAGRAMICRRLQMYPIECIARGYLTGSGLAEYLSSGSVTGLQLPPGLVDGSRLEPALYTPSAKAEVGEHDENITFERTVSRVGLGVAESLRAATLNIYERAERIARERGILLADTKVEFGVEQGNTDAGADAGAPAVGKTGAPVLRLGDEVLTPDSSRFWDAATYEPGKAQPSFDKQFVRDWLTSPESDWDKNSGEAPPELPADVVEKTRERYIRAYEMLTGRKF